MNQLGFFQIIIYVAKEYLLPYCLQSPHLAFLMIQSASEPF